MEKEGISRADLAKRLGKSRSAISQMFNKNPNLTIKKMVEIADSIGLDLTIIPTELKKEIGKKVKEEYVVVVVNPGIYRQDRITRNDTFTIPNELKYIIAKCNNVPKYRSKEILN
jgi:transcriptional regulator with XRE-family HTH domain